jgi:hypothetical protein
MSIEIPVGKVSTERALAGGHVNVEPGRRSVYSFTFARKAGKE